MVGDTRSYGYGNSRDVYLIRTDNSGNVEWARAYGGIGDETAYSLTETHDSNYIISGTTNSFGFGGNDAFLMKIDINGSVKWFHTYGGNTDDFGYDVVKTPDYGCALTGRRSSNTFGGDDVYLIKTDSSGNSNCDFGIYFPNIFDISNLQAINLNMATFSNTSEANPNLTEITVNSGRK